MQLDNETRGDSPMNGIYIRGVTKRYRSGKQDTLALQELNLDVAPGEFIAVVGPSGCGKSTLMRLVAGLLPVTTGSITVEGKVVKGPVTELGIVFQSPVLLDWRNTLDNVLFQADMRGLPVSDYRERANRLLKQVGLEDFADSYPHQLSGGMRQRASIARALLHDPPLLLMDEPFGALDALTREQMRLDLEQLWLATRKTVIFITHSVDEAVLLADRVLVMGPRPGKVVRELRIDLPRARGLAARRDQRFFAYCDEINEIFFSQGVLRRAGSRAAMAPAVL
jgi:NitT/TauT family transport system ATP-binding protein